MTISKDLFLAILSMDAYNRGYGAGVTLGDRSDASNGTVLIGNAAVSKNLDDAGIQSAAQAAGFYAIAYTTTADIGDPANGGVIPAGTTVISYRGTDSLRIPSDILTSNAWKDIAGWKLAFGNYNTEQDRLAYEFYRAVSDSNPVGSIQLTGHSLGGGLAGFVSGITGVGSKLFDPIGFISALKVLYTNVTDGVPTALPDGTPAGNEIDAAALETYFGDRTTTPSYTNSFPRFSSYGDATPCPRIADRRHRCNDDFPTRTRSAA